MVCQINLYAMAKKEGRIEIVSKHKKILQDTKTVRGYLKVESQKDIDKLRDFCERTDEDQENDEKGINAIEMIPTEKLEDVEDDIWTAYEDEVDRSEELLGSYNSIYDEVKTHRFVTFLDASYNSTITASNTSGTNVVNILLCMNLDLNNYRKLKELNVKDTIVQQKESIKSELKMINSDIASNFESVMKDWSSTSAPKYTILLDLRSVIFEQLFEIVAKESFYRKTPWFKGSKNKKKRYSQTKFFILGYNDESNIPRSALQRIENTALKVQDLFSKLSEFGKTGEKSEVLVENTFRDTISYLASAVILRKSFYVSSP